MKRFLCGIAILVMTAPSLAREEFRSFAVAADHEIASRAGAEILKKGGNAVDAAVATSFCLSVVRSQSCGIGGGGFMIIRFRDDPRFGDTTVALNYREMCAAAMGPDFYEKDPTRASVTGANSVAIPGSVAGLLHALDTYGTLDRATVLAPAIRAAEEGYVVDKHFLGCVKEITKRLDADPRNRERFSFVWKRMCLEGNVKIGDVIKNPEQAAALRLIAEKGTAGFYEGEVADAIIETIKKDGGLMTRDDLKSFKVATTQPLQFNRMGRTFITMPPPSSGGVAMAQFLGYLDYRPQGVHPLADGTFDPPTMHYMIEAWKHAFADRARWMADPAFAFVPTESLISDWYLKDRAKAITATTQPSDFYGTVPPQREDKGTSHFCVIDGNGNAVACTETINLEWGSLLFVEKFGFPLNDEMDDFLSRRGKANEYRLSQSVKNMPEPGKRPLSSMTPTIVVGADGNVEVIAGASNGPRIITSTAQVILNVLLNDDDAGTALKRPRYHHQWAPDILRVDKEFDAKMLEELKKYGHRNVEQKAVGNVQLIRRAKEGSGWDAACDPRKEGRPAGE